ncbi:sulfate ABC transporter substrate-binding protein [Marmoricola sp. URHB0036]|uniref:sulfate ABC transporter substrate-binding protein n=1 Tax=Marmoricola sp. URHB0036 TaxID=1298863 RepID=UPI000419993C|nr:sulfate ABC transporter substrate-binding protein [Marmoricola sp. URHB0036]
MTRTTPLKWFGAAALSLTVLASTSACSDPASGSSSGDKKQVSIVGFSILKTANKQVIADFQKTKAGKDVEFKESYGASGDQARAVIAGLKADEVHLSLEPDMTKLTDENLVDQDWKSGPTKGIATQSVVAIVTRPGNPKKITGWDDLAKPGVKIVTPNPGSSGSAKWNILAAYGHVLANGGSEADAQAYLKKFLANVAAFPGSGKDATTAFEGGTGDVLLSYENEAIQARAAGADFDYFIPEQTLLIQNPAAVTKDANSSAKAWLDFQLSKAGQTDYAKQGFRPLDDSIKVDVKGANDPADAFPVPKTLLTIDGDFGGWADANKKYFDEDNGIVTKLIAASGKS